MSDHVIKKYELLEMLKPFPDDVEVVVDVRCGQDSCPILAVKNGYDNRRRVAICCQAEDLSSDLETANDNLREADALLKRLSANLQVGGTPEEMAAELKTIAEDVEQYLDAR